MNAGMKSLGAYMPKTRVSNDDLAKTLDTSDEWIRSHTGIGFRHKASEEETCSYMGTMAARQALERAGMTAADIDQIIVATITSDYREFPSTACLIQENLGADHAGAFDIKAACTGFVYGIEVARGLIATGTARNILVVGVEKLSAITNWEDRNTAVLFGDGAGAAVVSHLGKDRGIQDSLLKARGAGAEALILRGGGTSLPYRPDMTDEDLFIALNGREVYNFAVGVNVDIIRELMGRNNLTFDEIKYIVPHQANLRMIQAAAKRMGVSMDKYYMNIEEYANTSSASIPLALNEMIDKDLLSPGDKILTVGFGGGLTFGGNYIVW